MAKTRPLGIPPKSFSRVVNSRWLVAAVVVLEEDPLAFRDYDELSGAYEVIHPVNIGQSLSFRQEGIYIAVQNVSADVYRLRVALNLEFVDCNT